MLCPLLALVFGVPTKIDDLFLGVGGSGLGVSRSVLEESFGG